MDKDILAIVRYSFRCEAGINTLKLMIEDYKKQAKREMPIDTIETILKTIEEEN